MARIASGATRVGIPCGVAYLVLGTIGRLSGLAPGLMPWIGLALPLLVGLGWSLLRQRQRPLDRIAQLCDLALGSDDLLLTAAGLTQSTKSTQPTGFQRLVLGQARARVQSADARMVVAWPASAGALRWLCLLGAIAGAMAVVPVCDPFGHRQHQQELARHHAQLQHQDQAIKERISQISASHPEDPTSTVVSQELAKIQAQLEAMKPSNQGANHQLLTQDHADLKDRLNQVRATRFEHSIDPKQAQELGGDADQDAAKTLSSALEHGQSAQTEQAIDQAMALAEQLQKASPATRSQLAQKLGQQLATLAAAASSQPSGLSAAVQHALDSLSQAGTPELRDQALQSLHDALESSKLEAKSDAQCARDIESLQEALKALHLADQLNDQGALDSASAKDLKAYAELYEQRLAELAAHHSGSGESGTGHGGEGQRTDTSRDNAAVDAQFQSAQDHSPVRAGATIAQWHTHGPSDPGKVIEDYQSSLGDIKQEVPEAMEREQVPSVYHDGVKKYFDGLQAQH